MQRALIRLSLTLATGLLAVAGTPVYGQDDVPTPDLVAALNIIVPDVYRTSAGEDEPTRIPGPTVVAEGDRLVTDATGVVLITWINNGTETVIGSDTTMTVTRLDGTNTTDTVIELDLSTGRLVSGAPDLGGLTWRLSTPAFTMTLLHGQFDLTVDRDGSTLLIVTTGAVEVGMGDTSLTVSANEYLMAAPDETPGAPEELSEDGVTVSLSAACTATAATNINVRSAPSEESRRLGGIKSGDVLWVRSSTEGDLWLNVYYHPVADRESTFGWIYGPAVLLDEDACTTTLRAPLDAVLFDGPGILQRDAIAEDHSDAVATAEPDATAEPG